MPADPEDIFNWLRLDARTTTSGRIQAEDISRLRAIGVRHVINLALADSPGGLADEERLMADAGLRYTHIPVAFDAPQESQFQAFRAAFDADSEPVHVHCIANYRVSAFFYRYHRQQGMAQDAARALMEPIWIPEASDHRDGGAWARFVSRGE